MVELLPMEGKGKDFSAIVSAELRRQNIGVRTLAKRIAGDGAPPERIESVRRSLRKWLARKHSPTQQKRDEVADALGLARELLRESPGRASDSALTREVVEMRGQLAELTALVRGRF